MAQDEVFTHAQRVASLLTDAWNEELTEAPMDSDVMTGMALGYAVAEGWIEPDPAFVPLLVGAERFLEEGSEGEVDE